MELRRHDGSLAGGHQAEPDPGRREPVQGIGGTREERSGRPVGIRGVPELVRFVEPRVDDAEPAVHPAPVRLIGGPVGGLVVRQAEGAHDREVRPVQRSERVHERAVPVEQDRVHPFDATPGTGEVA